MATTAAEQRTSTIQGAEARFHLSLNVGDLPRSVEFFRRFFGVEPAAEHADYAKFELPSPPLVLSLSPGRPAGVGALNHAGFRLASAAALVETQRRLEMAGIATLREEGVACCHSTQTKFWVYDPDGNMWEVYTLDAATEPEPCDRPSTTTAGAPLVSLACATGVRPRDTGPAPAIWAHRLDQALPAAILAHDGSVDQAQLHGTLNAELSPDIAVAFLAEVARVLKPGGEVLLHMLVADAPLPPGRLNLPGIASLVEVAPPVAEVIERLRAAGLACAETTLLADPPNFIIGGIALRECKLRAVK